MRARTGKHDHLLAASALRQAPPGRVQRACACAAGKGSCAACREEDALLRRRALGPSEPASVPPLVAEVLRGPGQPLDPATCGDMTRRFGFDFARVRVHTDATAARSAAAIDAAAYIFGDHIVFGAGRFAPASSEGRRLLAHEFAHVVQQSRGGAGAAPAIAPRGIAPSNDPAEREADAAAERVASGGDAALAATPQAPAVYRQGLSKKAPRLQLDPQVTATVLAACAMGRLDPMACAQVRLMLGLEKGQGPPGGTGPAKMEFEPYPISALLAALHGIKPPGPGPAPWLPQPPAAGPQAPSPAATPAGSGLELFIEKVKGLLKVELSFGGARVTFDLTEQSVSLARSFGRSMSLSIKAEPKPDVDVDKLLRGESEGVKLKPALSLTLAIDGRLEANATWEPTENRAGVGLWFDVTGSKCDKVGSAVNKALNAGSKLANAAQKPGGPSLVDAAKLVADVIKAAQDASEAQKECARRPSLKVGAEVGVGSPFPVPSGPSPLPGPEPGTWGMFGLRYHF